MIWFMFNDLINHKQGEILCGQHLKPTEMRFGFEVTMYVMNK